MTSWYLLLQKVGKSGSRHMLSKVCFKFRGELSIRYLIGFFKNSILSRARDGALKQYGKERRVFFTAFPIIDASPLRVPSDTTSVGHRAAASLIIIVGTWLYTMQLTRSYYNTHVYSLPRSLPHGSPLDPNLPRPWPRPGTLISAPP